jgi:hypothetical protein
MPDWTTYIAKLLITIGLVIAGIGLLLLIFRNTGIPLGRLPGDIVIERKNFTIYFPFATGIIISVILSILFYFFSRK